MGKQKLPFQQIFFTGAELKAVQMGLGLIMDDFKSTEIVPWNVDSRSTMKEILTAVRSAAAKIEKVTGVSSQMPPYIDGEEKDYLTKES
jgi:hypothetical protein